MATEVILPRVDMDMVTGKISKWLVARGAFVAKGQPLFEIETDKATMEIEAETEGTIRDLVEAGARDIPVGSVVAWIDAKGEAPPQHPEHRPPSHGAEAWPSVEGRRDCVVSGTAVGQSAEPEAQSGAGEQPRATPLARRLARDLSIDLAAVQGSGPRGRIQAADCDRHVAAQTASAKGSAGLVALPDALRVSRAAAPASFDGRQIEHDVGQKPVPTFGHDAPAPAGGLLNLVRLRDGEGPPVVLIHGFGADSNGWRPLLASLGVSRPLLGLDLPGHGQSPLGSDAGFVSLVDAVEEALLARGLQSATLIGHSLGAAVAVAGAARGTVDLKGLILLSPAGLGPDINGGFVRGFLAAESEASLTPWMHELVCDPVTIPPAFVRATLKTRVGSQLVETQRRIAEAVFPNGTQAFSIRADLARLAMPVRVIFGTSDRIIPARHAEALPPLAALHRLAAVGHMPHYEARDLVSFILRNDLARP